MIYLCPHPTPPPRGRGQISGIAYIRSRICIQRLYFRCLCRKQKLKGNGAVPSPVGEG